MMWLSMWKRMESRCDRSTVVLPRECDTTTHEKDGEQQMSFSRCMYVKIRFANGIRRS